MKKLTLNFLAITAFFMLLLAFTTFQNGGAIKGTISPADSAVQVMAISGMDTLKGVITNGAFTINNVKAGTYTVWVKTRAPYKDTSVQNVAVIDSTITDVGVIKLLQ